jgi:hypothetical protein
VLVGGRARWFIVAVSLTVMDAVVAQNDCGMIWQAWSGILWIRAPLLLLGAIWVGSLADVWAQVFREMRRSKLPQAAEITPRMATAPIEFKGDGDV